MTKTFDIAQKVPMMFRAQIGGRCQLQRLERDQEPDVVRWTEEWVERTYPKVPHFAAGVQTRTYTITWRFVANGGQDDSIIRPAIGAKGYPFYPGSSMKGIFRRACTSEQRDRYCGQELVGGEFRPGLLRFHGGYPTTTDWTESLIDIVHPQQDWQVKTDTKAAGAFAQISLYQPELRFGISSAAPIGADEWETIWAIWEQALAGGIGCRVSAGYGQPLQRSSEVLYSTRLKGQGQAAKLFDGTGEFRSNIFRAAIRGHALRILGGLTDASTADRLVEQLFGGVQGQGTVGLLRMTFHTSRLDLDTFGQGAYVQPTYEVEGHLIWMLQRSVPADQQEALKKLVAALTRFAMVLGGFGKSWRRADHRLFLPDYYDAAYKPLIGCHWQWEGERSLAVDVKVRKLDKVGEFIDEVRQIAAEWMQLQGCLPTPDRTAPWREAWAPGNVQVWGRMAEEAEDCEAIYWFHRPYREAMPRARIPEGSIYRSSLAGRVSQIGRIWHRMYPLVRLKPPEKPGEKPKPIPTPKYLELLTIFPDDSRESDQLLDFLKSHPRQFQPVWG